MKELILNFHGLGSPPAGVDKTEIAYWLDRTTFENVLDRLGDETGNQIPPFKITFDDGNISDASIAFPALAVRGMKATFFVCAGRIGKPGYLDELAIRDLLDGGMEVGSHGMHHLDWRRVSDEQLHSEVWHAKQMLEQTTGRSIDKVAIPFGSFDRRVLKTVRSTRVSAVYTSDGGMANSDSWLRPRNTLNGDVRGRDLVEKLARKDSVANWIYRSIVTRYKMVR